MRDHRTYDKISFHEIEMSLTKEGMLHLGETLIRHAILFKNNETLCLKKMGFIYTSENKQLSVSVNYPDSILENGKAKIKKVIWSKTDSSTYFESLFEDIILINFNSFIKVVKYLLFKIL